MFQLLRHALVGGDDFVEGVGDLSLDAELIAGHPHGKVSDLHGLKRRKQIVEIERSAAVFTALPCSDGRALPCGYVDPGLGRH
jgi:hypothetical protein